MFFSKIFKIIKVEGNDVLADVDVTNKKGVFSRSSHTEVFRKKSILKYLVKLTGKRLCRSLSLAFRHETFKKILLHRCFPIKSSVHLFHRTPVQFGNFDHHIYFCRKYLKFWCINKTCIENIARESWFAKIFFL